MQSYYNSRFSRRVLTSCGPIQLEKLIETKYSMVNRKDGSKLSSELLYNEKHTEQNTKSSTPNRKLKNENKKKAKQVLVVNQSSNHNHFSYMFYYTKI
jgi:hypothetical protein